MQYPKGPMMKKKNSRENIREHKRPTHKAQAPLPAVKWDSTTKPALPRKVFDLATFLSV